MSHSALYRALFNTFHTCPMHFKRQHSECLLHGNNFMIIIEEKKKE